MRNATQPNSSQLITPVTIQHSQQITLNQSPTSNPGHFTTSPAYQNQHRAASPQHPLSSQQLNEQHQKQLQLSAAFEQHRRFLQNYKKERGEEIKMMRDRYFSSNQLSSSSFIAQAEEEQQANKRAQPHAKKESKDPLLDAVSSKLQAIHKKIHKLIMHQPSDSRGRRFKIFDGDVSTKKDLERVTKERRFIRSQQEKYDYKEPQMPHRHPAKQRAISRSFHDEADLCRKAREFIERVHNEQERLLGKQMVRKKREEQKKKVEQRNELKKAQQIEEIKKEERRLKAQQNLLLMRQKLKINKIVNRNSIEQVRRIVAEKEHRLDVIDHTIKHTQKHLKFRKNNSILEKLQKGGQTSSVSDFDHEGQGSLPQVREMTISIEQLKQAKQKQLGARGHLKVGKKYKLSRPTQYGQSADERGSMESRLKTDYVESAQLASNSHQHQLDHKQFTNSSFSQSFVKPNPTNRSKQNESSNQPTHTNSNQQSQSKRHPQAQSNQFVELQEGTFGFIKQRGKKRHHSKQCIQSQAV